MPLASFPLVPRVPAFDVSLSILLGFLVALLVILSIILERRIEKRSIILAVPIIVLLVLIVGHYLVGVESNTERDVVWIVFLVVLVFCLGPRNLYQSALCDNFYIRLVKTYSLLYLLLCLFAYIYDIRSPAFVMAGSVYLITLLFFSSGYSIIPLIISMALFIFSYLLGARMPTFVNAVMISVWLYVNLSKGSLHISLKLLLSFLVGFVALGILAVPLIIDKNFGGDVAVSVVGYDFNTSGRAYYWPVVWHSFLDSPLLGYGLPVPEQMLGIPGWAHPHNDYLRLLHQTGIVGFAFFIFFIFLLLRRGPGGGRPSMVAVCSAASLGFYMITDNPLSYVFFVAPIMFTVLMMRHLVEVSRGAS